MKCPRCGKQMITTPKYPGFYLCYDCRVKSKISSSESQNSHSRSSRNTGRARQENVSYSDRVIRQSVKSRRKRKQNAWKGLVFAAVLLAVCALAVFLLWKFVLSSDEDGGTASSPFSQGASATAASDAGQTQGSAGASLEDYLKEKGLLTGERTEAAASMIGAISGYKYADSNIEIYEFDTNSEKYKTLAGGGEVELEGMEGAKVSAAAVNGKYILIGSPSQEAIDAFQTYQEA